MKIIIILCAFRIFAISTWRAGVVDAKPMKNIIRLTKQRFALLFWTLSTLAFSTELFAAQYSFNANVAAYRIHDTQTFPTWAPPKAWFTLEGVSSAGSCPVSGANVIFVVEESEMLKDVRLAKALGKTIEAQVDDVILDVNGYCKVIFLTVM